jgi:hypothetical protein
MMQLLLYALLALIGMLSCAALRAARTLTGGPGTEAQATRPNLSTEATTVNRFYLP